jgi:hypothetical protein
MPCSPPKNWDCPPSDLEEEQASPHVADTDFDWSTIGRPSTAAAGKKKKYIS